MICIYDRFTKQNGFFHNGYPTCGDRILNPFSCETFEQLNGDYSMTMQCPIVEEDDSSRFIYPGRIVRVSDGQLFTIHKMTTETVKGVPMISVEGRHIWYYFNDKLVEDCTVNMLNGGYWALYDLMANTNWERDPTGYLSDYEFSFGSNLPNAVPDPEHPEESSKSSYFNRVSLAYAILGSADSIISKWGGELHRDNFHYSINVNREGSRDNAFSIIHGWNCTEIKSSVDISNVITILETEDNLGNYYKGSVVPGEVFSEIGHHVSTYQKMSYNNLSNLGKDSNDYFSTRRLPEINYKATLVNLKDTTAEAGWSELESVKVGDRGTIFSDVYNITTKQKVISVRRNQLTERNEVVELGDFVHSSIAQSKYDKLVSGDTAAYRRLDAIEGLLKEGR